MRTEELKKQSKIKNLLIKYLQIKKKNLPKKKNANKINYFAKRFVAKEAFLKAIGTGLSNGFSFKDITVLNDKKGKPYIESEKKIDLFIKKKFKVKNYKIYLSISDEMKYSIAYVILQGNSK